MSKLRSDELVNMEGDGAPSFPQSATTIEPTADNQVATKSYVDLALSAASGNAVSATPPTNPALGSFWTDTSVSPSILKTWNGSMWIEFAGEGTPYTGFLGSPVEVLTPLDGAGVGGAVNYVAKTSEVSTEEVNLHSGYISKTELVTPFYGVRNFAKGNGILVMASTNYGVRTSLNNGLTWQKPVTPFSYVTRVLWTGQRFIASSRDSPWLIHSTDGINWTAATLPGNYTSWDIQDLTYSPTLDRVVGVNIDNAPYNILYSNDHGVTWSATNPPSSLNQNNRRFAFVRWGNGRFVATNYTNYNSSNHSVYSTDGINWSVGNSLDLLVRSLIFNPDNNTFYGLAGNGSDNQIYSTSDGNTWSYFTYGWGSDYKPESNGNSHFVYDNGVYYIMVQDGSGRLIYSTDLTNWNRMYLNGGYSIRGEGMSMIDGDLHYYCDTSPSAGFGLWRNRRSAGFGTPVDTNTSKRVRQVLTFENSNVYNWATDEIVADADFATVFDRNLINGRTGQTFTPDEVSDGVFVYIGSQERDIYSIADNGTGDTIKTNSELTLYGPSPTDVVFTSQNANTTPVSATDATVAFRKWTLETRASSSDPWTVVTESDDYDIAASQDGSTPWASSPTLQPNTTYRVKVAYHSANAETIESVYSTFETGPA